MDLPLLASLRSSLEVQNDPVSSKEVPFALYLLLFTFLLAFLGKMPALHTWIFLTRQEWWVQNGSVWDPR